MNSQLKSNIKKQLSALNLSVSELERRAGLKQSALYNILSDRSKNPSVEIVNAIAKELNCTIEELLGEEVHSHITERTSEEETADDYPWNAKLYIKAIQTIQTILEQKNIHLSKKQVLACVDEVYKYSSGISEDIDRRFAEWIIDKLLRQ